jgi:hypothetical protein
MAVVSIKDSIHRVVTAVRSLGISQGSAGKVAMSGDAANLNLRLAGLAASVVNLDSFTDKEIEAFFKKIEESEEDGKGIDIQLLRMSVAIQAVLQWVKEQGLPDVEPRNIVHECLGLPPEHPEILKEIMRIQDRARRAMGSAAPRPRLSA